VHLALGIADQAYVMTHGELQISGAASTILSQLDSLEASYLGHSESPAAATTGETSA
jgi:ABC-type branched-subunit amino acid transport system ATPase component